MLSMLTNVYQKLKSSTIARPCCLDLHIACFELTDQNYSACLKLLQERYGKRENIISCHLNKILNLEAAKCANNTKALRKFHDSIRNFDALRVELGSYGHLLVSILLKLLPIASPTSLKIKRYL